MTDGEELPAVTVTWRLPERRAKYFSKEQRQPTLEAFRPRPDEEAHAPCRVSVWDGDGGLDLTRAISLRGKPAHDIAVVALTAGQVRAVGAGLGRADVRTVGDPQGAPPAATEMERELHYGIEGLARSAAQDDDQHRALLSRLARACEAVFP